MNGKGLEIQRMALERLAMQTGGADAEMLRAASSTLLIQHVEALEREAIMAEWLRCSGWHVQMPEEQRVPRTLKEAEKMKDTAERFIDFYKRQ